MRYRLPSVVALLLLVLLPSRGIGLELCPSHLLLGIDCPLCGLVRSMSSLLHLDIGLSLMFHPLGGLFLLYLLGCVVTNRPDWWSTAFGRIASDKGRNLAQAGLATLVVAVWIFRL